MNLQLIGLSLGAALAFSGCALEMDDDVSEFSDVTSNHSASLEHEIDTHVYVSCYVDTSAYDEYNADRCFAFGTQPSYASFELTPHAPPSHVVWWISDNNGNDVAQSCTGVTCSVPILPGQTLHAGNYYIVNGTPTQGAAATAVYRYGGNW